jgi:hypothetical protein
VEISGQQNRFTKCFQPSSGSHTCPIVLWRYGRVAEGSRRAANGQCPASYKVTISIFDDSILPSVVREVETWAVSALTRKEHRRRCRESGHEGKYRERVDGEHARQFSKRVEWMRLDCDICLSDGRCVDGGLVGLVGVQRVLNSRAIRYTIWYYVKAFAFCSY